MNFRPEEIARKMSGSPSGNHCVFVPLDEKWALKIYRYKEARDQSYEMQSLAAAHDLGPLVGETDIEFTTIERTYYAFVSEIIEDPWRGVNFFDSSEDEYEESKEVHKALYDIVGIEHTDNCAFNHGRKDGRMMILDFGNFYKV